jgi:tRNA modification GTPase
VLAVFDASQPLDNEDEAVCSEIADKKVIPVLNKIDLPVAVNLIDLETRLHAGPSVSLSAKCCTGLENLVERIQHIALGADSAYGQEQTGGAIVSRVRHRDALVKTEQSLGQASVSLKEGMPLDLVAVDLHAALDHLGEITGHVSTEDILDQVFRDFCIGK